MATAAEKHEGLEPVYVWDLVVRITHWAIAFSIILLSITGFYLAHPFQTHGPAREHFVTGWAKSMHFYGGIVFGVAVLARMIWMITGPRRSGWRNFIPVSKRRRRDFVQTLRFYMLLRPTPPTTIGHNPLAGLSYLAVFGLYVLAITTGWALYSVSSHSYMQTWRFLLPLFNGAQGARWLHHVTMWALLCFFVAHMFFAMLTSRTEKNGAIDSIFSGYKFVPKGQPPDDE